MPKIERRNMKYATLDFPVTTDIFQEEAMADEEKCRNPVCTCKPQPGGKYCSASCEGAGKTIEIDCDCGHPECAGNF